MILSKRFADDGKETLKLTKSQEKARRLVIEKLKKGYYREKEIACDCGNNSFEVISKKDRYGIPVKTCICRKCGLILSNPVMDQDSLNRFYDEDYRNLYVSTEGPSQAFFDEQYRHGLRIGEYLESAVSLYSANVLEIGTGAGGIIKAIQEKYNANVVGIDLGSEYLDFGRRQGVELYQESAEECLKRGKKYDVIILSHVLEHFLDLGDELDKIKGLLVENGLIYIEVPGIKNTYRSYGTLIKSIQNAHIRYFSLDTLKQVMGWNGFRLIEGDEYIQSIFMAEQEAEIESKIKKSEKEIINYYDEIVKFIRSHEKAYVWYVHILPFLAKVKNVIRKIAKTK